MTGFCKGSFALGSACGKCSRCEAEQLEINGKALNSEADAWRYKAIGLVGPSGRKYAYTDDRDHVTTLVNHGGFIVEALVQPSESKKSNNDAFEEALIKIAFDPDVSDLAGNPGLWSSTIAYLALGGRIEGGKKLDTKNEVLKQLTT